jgi:hypothetical protein
VLGTDFGNIVNGLKAAQKERLFSGAKVNKRQINPRLLTLVVVGLFGFAAALSFRF